MFSDYPVAVDMGYPHNPCDPSPCGPNSRCLITPQHAAACSCLPGYRGVPPVCKPECVVSSECPQTQACVNQKCVDPCPGTCGLNGYCLVMNHNPVCSCPPGYIGNPFSSCQLPPAGMFLISTIETKYVQRTLSITKLLVNSNAVK